MSTEHALPIAGTTDSLRTISQVTAAGVVQTEVVALPNITASAPVASTVGSSSAELIAATVGIRPVLISVPTSADTGICINFDAAATTSNFLIESGGALKVNTAQQIRAIRAGSTNVTAYVLTGVLP